MCRILFLIGITMAVSKASIKKLYDRDYVLWLKTTAQQLRSRNLAVLDWENLIEEIEQMGKDKKRELKNRLTVLLMHLLKWQDRTQQRSWYGNSWISTIVEQRRQIDFLLEDSLSLKPYYREIIDRCYSLARRDASKETGQPLDTFPVELPFSPENVLNPDYLPDR